MRALPTLRRELIAALALVFAGALLVAATGFAVMLPLLRTPAQTVAYVALLIVLDVAVFSVFGRYLLQRRVLNPIDRLVQDVEAIAAGDYARRLPPGETSEMARLSDAVGRMAEHLITHQGELAENVRSLQATNRDLTEARDELVRVERMVSVGRLAAGIAHEIGNPLGAVLGYLGLIARGADERARELVDAAEREARRIDRIVRGLLDYARPREVRPHAIDANEVVEQTLELLATQGRFGLIEVRRELAADLPQVRADHYQLQQVLVNLLLNATDALDSTGEPALSVRTSTERHAPEPHRPSRRKDDPPDIDYSHRRRFHRAARVPRTDPFAPGAEVVRIDVADNGPGIPTELIDQIFEPFVTNKEPGKGTGLGLAIAARLIDAMGGTIRVESRPGEGAAFTLLLPAAGSAARHASAEPAAAAQPTASRGP